MPATDLANEHTYTKINTMYKQYIDTPDKALIHLAFHCSLKDGELQNEELDLIAANVVAKGLNKEMDLKEEQKPIYRITKL